MLRTFAIACNCRVGWVGRREGAQSPGQSLAGAMCNGAAGEGKMRLRSGKNSLPSGSVLSRLHERLHAIARKNQRGAQAANLRLRPVSFNGPASTAS
jgi:hypothetical protein